MKKFALTAAMLLGSLAVVHAGELRQTPRGEPQALASADYGGISFATSAFSTAMTTICVPTSAFPSCAGIVYGVWFSTGDIYPAPGFVDIFDSSDTRLANAGGDKSIRIYNQGVFAFSSMTLSGFNGPPKPIRFSKGIIFRPSVAAYNQINILYWLEKAGAGNRN